MAGLGSVISISRAVGEGLSLLGLGGKIPPILGYSGKDIAPEYLITITVTRPKEYVEAQKSAIPKVVKIVAPIQEPVQLMTEAIWQQLSAAYVVSRVTTEFVQMVSDYATTNRYISRRIWVGTNPIDFTLNLKFHANSDPRYEVDYPMRELLRMALPFSGEGTLGKFLLIPPGPNPFEIAWLSSAKKYITGTNREGEKIDVQIGKYLLIKNVVVKSVSTSIEPKFVKGGFPLAASCSVRFQTFEIQTKESLDDQVFNPSSGSVTGDVGGSLPGDAGQLENVFPVG